jgi:plastocyanin
MNGRSSKALAGAIAVAISLSAAAAAPAAPPTVTIAGDGISNYSFAPKTVKIGKNRAVKWSWESNAPHNVTFRKLGKASKTGASGTFRHRFKKKGTYRYVCTIHGFRGKVVVR